MTLIAKKIALSPHQPSAAEDLPILTQTLNLISNVEIKCHVRIGTLTLTIAELQDLKQNQVLSLAQKTDEPVDVLVNQHVVARGELMSCEDYFAIQITEVAS
jgi:flagellar motor switch protein FliN/FliY